MKRQLTLTVCLWLVAATASAEERPFVSSRSLSTTLAQQAALVAMQNCEQQGYQVAAAVVDRSGLLQAFARMPLAGAHTVDVSIGKARAAASFQAPTMTLAAEEFVGLREAPGFILVGGGLPIRIGGHMYGAVAVSGAPGRKVTGDIDEACAQAGIDAIREAIEFGTE